ncbi:transposase [bacterium]|nr:transposase [bacterium]
MGRSRGGFGTKVHAAVTPRGHPVALERTGSQASDRPRLPGRIAGVATAAVLADRGYDSDANRAAIRAAVLRPGQAVPPGGHPVREEGRERPGVRLGRVHRHHACVAFPSDPTSISTA